MLWYSQLMLLYLCRLLFADGLTQKYAMRNRTVVLNERCLIEVVPTTILTKNRYSD